MAANMSFFCRYSSLPMFLGVSSAITLPPSITMARSAWGKISSIRCSVMMTVVPSSRLILRTVFRKSEAAMGSSWLVGSSRISTSGCMAMMEARFSSCFCPPERLATSLWNQSWMPK